MYDMRLLGKDAFLNSLRSQQQIMQFVNEGYNTLSVAGYPE